MEEFDPEQRVGHEEAADLGAGEIELVRAPIGMDLVLEEHFSVEGRKTLGVGAKASGDPVEDHADAGAMTCVDEVHELLWGAITRGGSVVSRYLVTP